VFGGFSVQNDSGRIAQPKLAWLWLLEADFETCVELKNCGASELQKPSHELRRLLSAGIYLDISRIRALGHAGLFRDRNSAVVDLIML